jgi:hypothetical protein
MFFTCITHDTSQPERKEDSAKVGARRGGSNRQQELFEKSDETLGWKTTTRLKQSNGEGSKLCSYDWRRMYGTRISMIYMQSKGEVPEKTS